MRTVLRIKGFTIISDGEWVVLWPPVGEPVTTDIDHFIKVLEGFRSRS